MGVISQARGENAEGGEKKRSQAWARFRERLLDGTLRPGSTLTQSELAETLGISLTPLRELLVLLEDCQLVEVRHRAGITIAYPDLAFIRENLQFRAIIEMSAMETFCLRAERDWIDAQVALHRSIRAEIDGKVGDFDRYNTEVFDQPFHQAIVASLDNETISRSFERVMDNVTLTQVVHRKFYTADQIASTIDEHLAILDRIAARDVEGAKSALQSHFKLSTHRIIGG